MKILVIFTAIFLITISVPLSAQQLPNDTVFKSTGQGSEGLKFELLEVVGELPRSWALAFSPTDDLWITHREGGLSQIKFNSKDSNYQRVDIDFTPDDLLTGGQGGLLDIIFHPDYEQNQWIYASYTTGTANNNTLKIVRFKVEDTQINELEDIFEVASAKDTPVHYGARMAFSNTNALFVATGDGFDYREQAQVKSSQLGKILKMTDEGKAHPNNPFYENEQSAVSYVYSLGHRNPQGLVMTGEQQLISHEHGPAGGDEINVIRAGANYGWPVITNGKDYIGALISPFTEYPGMEQPDLDWTPSIAPSGMTYYTHKVIPELHQHLLVTSLKFKQIYAVPYSQGKVGKDRTLLLETNVRLRDIEKDKQGNVWVLGDGEPAVLYKLAISNTAPNAPTNATP